MSLNNKRLWYAVQQAGIAICGSNTFTAVHGLQSIGVNTKFNLQHVFELGQSEAYETVDDVPDVEITMEKVIDGRPLLWHMLTRGATNGSLIGRSNVRATIGLSIYNDTFESASGSPLSQCTASGVYASSVEYTIPVNGPITEQVTAVGNSKIWSNSFSDTDFTNDDAPTASGGIQRREDVIFGSGQSKLPKDIPGVNDTDSYLYTLADGNYDSAIQQIKISCNLGREQLFELGHKGPYHRYVSFPVEVRCDIEAIAKELGDDVTASDVTDNVVARPIYIKLRSGTIFDLGTKNYLTSSTMGGAGAGQQGGNGTLTYSYMNHNRLTVIDPEDPSGL